MWQNGKTDYKRLKQLIDPILIGLVVILFILLLIATTLLAEKKLEGLIRILKIGISAEFRESSGFISLAGVVIVALLSFVIVMFSEVKSLFMALLRITDDNSIIIEMAIILVVVTLFGNFIFLGFIKAVRK